MDLIDTNQTACPICQFSIDRCQCLVGGTGYHDRSKRIRVVLDHLYMFTDKQIKHIVDLEREWCSEYADKELNQILKQIENETGKKTWQDCIK